MDDGRKRRIEIELTLNPAQEERDLKASHDRIKWLEHLVFVLFGMLLNQLIHQWQGF